jgi:exopolysaccharide production protein ExoZ
LKLASVQYLRAVAALLVVAYHTNNMGLLRPHFTILGFGGYGVDLFFVISGFIITVTTARDTSPGVFFRKRLIRIVPLYWLVTFVYVLIAFMLIRLTHAPTRTI